MAQSTAKLSARLCRLHDRQGSRLFVLGAALLALLSFEAVAVVVLARQYEGTERTVIVSVTGGSIAMALGGAAALVRAVAAVIRARNDSDVVRAVAARSSSEAGRNAAPRIASRTAPVRRRRRGNR